MIVNKVEAIKLLENGNVIGIPTDTVYGFAVNKKYGHKIYDIKKRPKDKKLISFIGLNFNLGVDEYTQGLFDKYWPGNYTFIILKEGEYVSYRIPNEPNILELLEDYGDVLLTSSANYSGEEAITSDDEFLLKFPDIPLLESVLPCNRSNVASTIFKIQGKEIIKIR